MFVLVVIISLISTIQACPTGQYLHNSTNTCQSCSSHCLSCVNYSSCSRCLANYYINQNMCRICSDTSCECNGLTIACKDFTGSKIFVIVVTPICIIFVLVLVGCCVCKACRPNERQIAEQVNNQDFFTCTEPTKMDNLGILSMVMKNKWSKDDKQQGIDPKSICAICLGEQCQIKTLCKHTYHAKCLILWSNRKSNCPICKRENLTSIRKFCSRCQKQFIETSLKNLSQFAAEFYNMCSNCKQEKNKRLDSLCEMQLVQYQ